MIRIALAKGRLFEPAAECFAKAGIVIDPISSEHDAVRKPLHTFRHCAPPAR
jgi:ATP phosphoribosyltransferase